MLATVFFELSVRRSISRPFRAKKDCKPYGFFTRSIQKTVNQTNKMTKKNFIACAKDIAALANRKNAKIHAEFMAAQFAKMNPRFDKSRFFAACGVN